MVKQSGDRIDPATLAQFRLAHLSMIQAVVGRLSGYSATVKNFTVTVAAGLLALSAQPSALDVPWWAAGFLGFFLLLDAYYLALEKSFRDLYDDVASRDLSDAADIRIHPRRVSPTKILSGATSTSVWMFHIPLIVFGAMMIYAVGHVSSPIAAEQRSGSADAERYVVQQRERNKPDDGAAVPAPVGSAERAPPRARDPITPASAP